MRVRTLFLKNSIACTINANLGLDFSFSTAIISIVMKTLRNRNHMPQCSNDEQGSEILPIAILVFITAIITLGFFY
jgi:hypothetical protein